MARQRDAHPRGSDAYAAARQLDAGRARARRQTRHPYRTPWPFARGDAIHATRLSGLAMVSAIIEREHARDCVDVETIDRAWNALASVMDPEIPIVSIVEL